MYKLSKRSLRKLEGVHPHLVSVVKRALQLSEVDFSVTEGLRSLDRQHQLFNEGHSKTLNSRHLTGHAVDLMAWVGGSGSWDWEYYHMIAKAMKEAAEEQGVHLVWGGDWKNFPDGPHFQLDWEAYPK
jgi:peptidoglycan L-alanyl-D-glutamate endopeptidase CwlK